MKKILVFLTSAVILAIAFAIADFYLHAGPIVAPQTVTSTVAPAAAPTETPTPQVGQTVTSVVSSTKSVDVTFVTLSSLREQGYTVEVSFQLERNFDAVCSQTVAYDGFIFVYDEAKNLVYGGQYARSIDATEVVGHTAHDKTFYSTTLGGVVLYEGGYLLETLTLFDASGTPALKAQVPTLKFEGPKGVMPCFTASVRK